MNYLFRAFLSLKKHKTKSILLIIAVGLIATLLFCGISINDTVAVVQNNAMQNVGTQVKVEYDRAKIKNNSYQFISADTLKQLDSLAHIKDSTHVSYYLAMYKNIKLSQFSGSMGINVVSVTDSSKLNEFSTNSYEIVGGRAITKADEGKHVAVISDGIAKLNKLHVNDSITLLGLVDKSITENFKIIGIFKTSVNFSEGAAKYQDFPDNTIYTDYNSGSVIDNAPQQNYKIDPASATAVFYDLDSPDNVEPFIAAAKKVPGMENYSVTANTSLYNRVTSSLKLADSLVSIMIILILAAGCLIFALMLALSLRGRRREFGILLAVGEKKVRILLQLFLETLIPVLIAFCIGVFASGFISQKICDNIVSNSNTYIQHQDQENWSSTDYILNASSKMLAGGEFVSDTAVPINSLSVSVTPVAIAEFAGCGLLIAFISILFPIIRILNLSPMAILSKKE